MGLPHYYSLLRRYAISEQLLKSRSDQFLTCFDEIIESIQRPKSRIIWNEMALLKPAVPRSNPFIKGPVLLLLVFVGQQ